MNLYTKFLLLTLISSASLTNCSSLNGSSTNSTTSSGLVESTKNESVNSTTSSSKKNNDVIDEETWNEIVSNDKFENVTFEMNVQFKEQDGEPVDSTAYYKYYLDGDKGLEIDGENSRLVDKEVVDAIRTLFIDISLGILSNLNDFTYSVEIDKFVSNKTITIDVDVMGEKATLINDNVEVTINDQNQILSIKSNMIQDIKGNDITNDIVLDVEFKFSDYGTTVVA